MPPNPWDIPLIRFEWHVESRNSITLISKSLLISKPFVTRPCTTVRDSEDILDQSPFKKYTTSWVFLALYFALAHLTHGKIIFDTLEQSSFQKYTTSWVFLVLHYMLYLFICVFVYLYLRICA